MCLAAGLAALAPLIADEQPPERALGVIESRALRRLWDGGGTATVLLLTSNDIR
jgi:hypothetical protein